MNRKTIGVLIPIINQYFLRDLRQGILDEAEKLGYNLVLFCGSLLSPPFKAEVDSNVIYHMVNDSNVIYQMVNADNIDAVIGIGSMLSHYSGVDYYLEYMERFKGKPIVHAHFDVADKVCVSIDNYKSFKKLMVHILEKHDYKKYAYVSGPYNTSDGYNRLQAFKDMMREHEIDEENYVIYEGTFLQESGFKAANVIIDDMKFDVNIFICANDEMAVGVKDALDLRQDKYRKTPFTGFDNSVEATNSTPAYTTIQMPLRKVGIASVQEIHRLLSGDDSINNRFFEGELIVRESCGCVSQRSNAIVPNLASYDSEEKWIKSVFDKILQEDIEKIFCRVNSAKPEVVKKQMEELIHILLIETLKDTNQTEIFVKSEEINEREFLETFKEIVHENKGNRIEDSNWLFFIRFLRNRLIEEGILKNREMIQNLIYDATIIAGEYSLRAERKENYKFMKSYYSLSGLNSELMRVTNTDELMKNIVPYLGKYKISDYFVVLFEKPVKNEVDELLEYPKEATLKLGYQNGVVLPECKFTVKEMLPEFLLNKKEGYKMIMYPLFYKNTHFGYLLSDMSNIVRWIFGSLREYMQNTLERLAIQDKLEISNAKLAEIATKDLMTNLYNRRGIFEYINKLLVKDRGEKEDFGIVFGDIDKLKHY